MFLIFYSVTMASDITTLEGGGHLSNIFKIQKEASTQHKSVHSIKIKWENRKVT